MAVKYHPAIAEDPWNASPLQVGRKVSQCIRILRFMRGTNPQNLTSSRTIARKLGFGERNCRYRIQTLLAAGFIEFIRPIGLRLDEGAGIFLCRYPHTITMRELVENIGTGLGAPDRWDCQIDSVRARYAGDATKAISFSIMEECYKQLETITLQDVFDDLDAVDSVMYSDDEYFGGLS